MIDVLVPTDWTPTEWAEAGAVLQAARAVAYGVTTKVVGSSFDDCLVLALRGHRNDVRAFLLEWWNSDVLLVDRVVATGVEVP